MSDHEFEAYLALLSKMLRLSGKQREAIAAELRDHLDQRMTELQAAGVDRDDAVLRALEEFGDAAGLAAELSQIRQYVRRRRIMKATLTTLSAAAAIILLTLALLPQTPGIDLGNTAVADDGKTQAAAPPAKPDPNEKTRQALTKRIEVDFQANQLDNVFTYLRDVAGVSVLVQWPFLVEAGIPHETPITMRLQNVSAGQVLDFVLEQAGGTGVELGYAIVDGVVVINLTSQLAFNREIRIYNCRDLVGYASGDAALGNTGFGDDAFDEGGFGGTDVGRSRRPLSEREVRLADLVRNSIEPNSWRALGGATGSIDNYEGLLVINQTPQTHEQIAGFLELLRKYDRQPQPRAKVKDLASPSSSTGLVAPFGEF